MFVTILKKIVLYWACTFYTNHFPPYFFNFFVHNQSFFVVDEGNACGHHVSLTSKLYVVMQAISVFFVHAFLNQHENSLNHYSERWAKKYTEMHLLILSTMCNRTLIKTWTMERVGKDWNIANTTGRLCREKFRHNVLCHV